MATFQFDFVGPERTLYSGQVDAVQLPGIEGEMTVLAGHSPVLTALKVSPWSRVPAISRLPTRPSAPRPSCAPTMPRPLPPWR